MNTEAVARVLVIYPREFLCYEKFERRVSRILSRMGRPELASLEDHNEYLKRYRDEIVPEANLVEHLSGETLAGVTHLIVFDDGKSFKGILDVARDSGVEVRKVHTPITRVVNKDRDERYDVYIGRGTPWGNPYAIGYDGDREEVIHKYKYDFDKEHLRFNKTDVLRLRGKILGCHCKPAACHGDVIATYLNSLDDGK